MQIWPLPTARRVVTKRPARRTDELEPRHQFLGSAQLVVGVRGEVLVAQRLHRREAQSQWCLVGTATSVVIRVVTGLFIHRNLQLLDFNVHHNLGHRLPESSKRLVVQTDVFRMTNQGGAASPIHRVAAINADQTEGVDKRQHTSHWDGQARSAENATERDGHPIGVHVTRCVRRPGLPTRGCHVGACVAGPRGTSTRFRAWR